MKTLALRHWNIGFVFLGGNPFSFSMTESLTLQERWCRYMGLGTFPMSRQQERKAV